MAAPSIWQFPAGGVNLTDAKFHKKNFKKQAQIVSTHITSKTQNVLELGAGNAFNTKLLAKQYPNIHFTAMDLPNRNFTKTKVRKNISLIEDDFTNLKNIKPHSQDLVFAVETLDYAHSKLQVAKQIAKVLKPGGTLIVFDVYEPLPQSKMTADQKRISAITLASMSVTSSDQYIGDFQKYLKSTGFTNIKTTDLTKNIHPNLLRLEKYSRFYFTHPTFARLIRKFVSDTVTANAIAGYLMPLTFDGKTIHQYNLTIATKRS